MTVPTSLYPLSRMIYPLPDPKAGSTKSIQVLALGLPRSGTDSLCKALTILGYANVSHGFKWWCDAPEVSELYCRLADKVAAGETPGKHVLRQHFFDRVLADCEATTDIPAAWFAAELLVAYPDAKVILNRRRDVQAWKSSFRTTVLPVVESRLYWLYSWFNAELFWLLRLTYRMHGRALFEGDFEKNAEAAYVQHYERLEAQMRQSGRHWLDWSVEDGW